MKVLHGTQCAFLLKSIIQIYAVSHVYAVSSV